jgi:hypothetical protein
MSQMKKFFFTLSVSCKSQVSDQKPSGLESNIGDGCFSQKKQIRRIMKKGNAFDAMIATELLAVAIHMQETLVVVFMVYRKANGELVH